MLSFHNDPKIKEKYLNRVRKHRELDNIIQGIGWSDGKGCAVGCTLESYSHYRYPIELGLPIWSGKLEDIIFENLPEKKSNFWPEIFLDAIPVGVCIEKVKHQLAIIRMDNLLEMQKKLLELHKNTKLEKIFIDVISSIVLVKKCSELILNKSFCDFSELQSAAKSAAWSAGRSAESAAWSAELEAKSAKSAADSAESKAWSAWSAARSSAESARSAAKSAAESARSAAKSADSAAWSARSAAKSAASVWSAACSAAWSADSAAASVLSEACSAAGSAARSAGSAANSVWSAESSASSAESAAKSASWSAKSADSAAWSAWSAARSAGRSAESAAWSVLQAECLAASSAAESSWSESWKKESENLIELLKQCK